MQKKFLATPEPAKPKHQSEYTSRTLKIIFGVDAGIIFDGGEVRFIYEFAYQNDDAPHLATPLHFISRHFASAKTQWPQRRPQILFSRYE